jgi:polyphosphate glucokinase
MAAQIAVGCDVGGSGIKVAAVDVATGQLAGPRLRVATPQPSSPDVVVPTIIRTVRRALRDGGLISGRSPAIPFSIGVGMPSVVIDGVTKTAANIDPSWVEYDLQSHLRAALKAPVYVLNDADAAGLAEMRFGAGRGQAGTVLMLTLGTGIGSALFRDGVLVPNTEFGHLQVRGKDAERRAAASIRVSKGLSWHAWSKLLAEYLAVIDALLWPDLVIIGGGISKEADKFIHELPSRMKCVPALLQNQAGIVGAATLAAEAAQFTAPQASPGAA